MSRRLPVYIVLDTSGSMFGEPIEAVRNGVRFMINKLRQMPQAQENVFLSIITFNDTAQQIIPLTDLPSFQMVDIHASGLTALGEALKLVSQCIDNEVKKNTAETKGDWKPLVFILTDGMPTDDNWNTGLVEFKKRKTAHTVACAAGNNADTSILKQITDDVISIATDMDSIGKFFERVTDSIVETSTNIEATGKNQMPPPPDKLIVL